MSVREIVGTSKYLLKMGRGGWGSEWGGWNNCEIHPLFN